MSVRPAVASAWRGGATHHFREAARGDDVPRVDEAVQVASRLLYRLAHVIVAVEVEDIRDEVESILIVLDFRVQAGEIEAVGEVVLVDLAEILVAPRRDKLCHDVVSKDNEPGVLARRYDRSKESPAKMYLTLDLQDKSARYTLYPRFMVTIAHD